tara:strand:- start:162 stop:344 length:183 start_codon:yes stop_codon:yes gene_type:complete
MKYILPKSLSPNQALRLLGAISKIEILLVEHNYSNKQIKKEINEIIPKATRVLLTRSNPQ